MTYYNNNPKNSREAEELLDEELLASEEEFEKKCQIFESLHSNMMRYVNNTHNDFDNNPLLMVNSNSLDLMELYDKNSYEFTDDEKKIFLKSSKYNFTDEEIKKINFMNFFQLKMTKGKK
jgi:hypothetical protein